MVSTSNSLFRLLVSSALLLWFVALSVTLWPEAHLGWVAFTPQESLVWGRILFVSHVVQWCGLLFLGQLLLRKKGASPKLLWLLGGALFADVLCTLQARNTALSLQNDVAASVTQTLMERLLYGLPILSLAVGIGVLVVTHRLFSRNPADSNSVSKSQFLSWVLLPAFGFTLLRLGSVDTSLQSAFSSPRVQTQRRALHWLFQKEASQATLELALPLLSSTHIGELTMRALKEKCTSDDVNGFLIAVSSLVKGDENAAPLIELLRSCPSSSSNIAAIEILKTTSSAKIQAQATSVLFAHREILGAQSASLGEWFCGVSVIRKEVHLDVGFTLLRGSDVSRQALAKCAMKNSSQAKVAQHALGKSVQGLRQWTLTGLQHEESEQQELALFRLRNLEPELVDEEVLSALCSLLVDKNLSVARSALHTLLELGEEKKKQALRVLVKQNPASVDNVIQRLKRGTRNTHAPFSPQALIQNPRECALSINWQEASKCIAQVLQQTLDDDEKILLENIARSPLEPRRLALVKAFRALPAWPNTTNVKTKKMLLEILLKDSAVSVRIVVVDALHVFPKEYVEKIAAVLGKDKHKGVRQKAKSVLAKIR
ncbi:MAG: hypothetical protein GY822_27920 [Deltaproteobacteria bacterium]|nr:hypothetical protein [Deltaproteobacteria bacterium]